MTQASLVLPQKQYGIRVNIWDLSQLTVRNKPITQQKQKFQTQSQLTRFE